MPEVFSLTNGKRHKQLSTSQLTFVVSLLNIVIPKHKKTSGAQGNSLHTLTKTKYCQGIIIMMQMQTIATVEWQNVC